MCTINTRLIYVYLQHPPVLCNPRPHTLRIPHVLVAYGGPGQCIFCLQVVIHTTPLVLLLFILSDLRACTTMHTRRSRNSTYAFVSPHDIVRVNVVLRITQPIRRSEKLTVVVNFVMILLGVKNDIVHIDTDIRRAKRSATEQHHNAREYRNV